VTELDQAARRVRRLVRWYPKAWRLRYGDEFAELLIADIAERPHCWRRTVDVARNGIAVRLGHGGLVHGLDPSERADARLASVVPATAGFLLVGLAMWSQLAIGWQWSRPAAPATTFAIVAMSCLVGVFGVLAVLAALPVLWALAARVGTGNARNLVAPLALLVLGSAVTVFGAWHFALGWPGTGGHPWAHQHLLPGRFAALTWAGTLSITSYWAHPAALLGFPAIEVAWMAVSPIAFVCAIAGGARLVRRLELSPRVLRLELALARIACAAMVVFLAAACCWIVAGGSGPRNLFHIGAIDLVGVAVMGATLLFARRAGQDARDALALCADGK
jgi:hypothetical protein